MGGVKACSFCHRYVDVKNAPVFRWRDLGGHKQEQALGARGNGDQDADHDNHINLYDPSQAPYFGD